MKLDLNFNETIEQVKSQVNEFESDDDQTGNFMENTEKTFHQKSNQYQSSNPNVYSSPNQALLFKLSIWSINSM